MDARSKAENELRKFNNGDAFGIEVDWMHRDTVRQGDAEWGRSGKVRTNR